MQMSWCLRDTLRDLQRTRHTMRRKKNLGSAVRHDYFQASRHVYRSARTIDNYFMRPHLFQWRSLSVAPCPTPLTDHKGGATSPTGDTATGVRVLGASLEQAICVGLGGGGRGAVARIAMLGGNTAAIMLGQACLLQAADAGHAAEAMTITAAGASVNSVDNLGWTPSHAAFGFGHRTHGGSRGPAGRARLEGRC